MSLAAEEQVRPSSTVAPARPGAATATVTRTGAGVALQATWLAYLLYGLWAAVALPEHPEPHPVVGAALEVVGLVILAATAGLLFRRRWALVASAGLALPMVGLAVMCFQADAGLHWIAESAFALAIVALSFHPASWRMHTA